MGGGALVEHLVVAKMCTSNYAMCYSEVDPWPLVQESTHSSLRLGITGFIKKSTNVHTQYKQTYIVQPLLTLSPTTSIDGEGVG